MPKKVGVLSPQIWGAKHQIFDHLFETSALDTAYLQNETSHRQIKMLVLIYNVSPKSWPTIRDLTRLLIVTHPSASVTLQTS